MKTWSIAIALILVLSGCAGFAKTEGGDLSATESITTVTETLSDGTTTVTVTETRQAQAQQPQNPEEGATARAGSAAAGLQGGSVVPDAARLMQAATLTWIGAALILLGVGSFALRFTSYPFAKLIPWTASLAAAGCGIGFLAWPYLTGYVPIVVLLGLVGAGLYLVIHNGYGLNYFKKKVGG